MAGPASLCGILLSCPSHDHSFVPTLQDLAVVVLLMLIPLLAPNPDGSTGGLAKIASALGTAAVKAVVCIVGIVFGGRLLIQPLYKQVGGDQEREIGRSSEFRERRG